MRTVTFSQKLIPLILEDVYDNEDELSFENACFSTLTVKVMHCNYCMQPSFKYLFYQMFKYHNIHKVTMDPTLCQKVLVAFTINECSHLTKSSCSQIFLILDAKYTGIYLRAQWSTRKVCSASIEWTIYPRLRNLLPALSVTPFLQTCPFPREKDRESP